jgi:hypothetical protein
VKFDIGDFYENLLRKSKFGQNRTKVSGSLREDQSTCVYVYIYIYIYIIVDSNTKYFVARQQREGNTLLLFRGIIKHFYLVKSDKLFNNTKNVLLLFSKLNFKNVYIVNSDICGSAKRSARNFDFP